MTRYAKNPKARAAAPKDRTEAQAAAAQMRALLSARSDEVAALVDIGEYETINEAIISLFYEKDGRRDFRGFYDWKTVGKRVKKGEKGWPVWGRPLREDPAAATAQPAAVGEAAPQPVKLSQEVEAGKARMWPMAYLFHAAQVEDDPNAGKFIPKYPVRPR